MSGLGDVFQSLSEETPQRPSNELDDFFMVAQDASDVEKGAAASRLFEKSFGLKSHDGAFLNKGKPLSGGAYYSKMQEIYDTQGASMESEKLKAWKAIPAEDREARLKVAREGRGFFKNLASDAVSAITLVPPSIGSPDLRKPDDYDNAKQKEDDSILAEYEASLEGEQWLSYYRAIEPDLSERAKSLVKSAIESGEIPARLKNDFMALDKEEASQVSFLVHASRPSSDKNIVRDMLYAIGGMAGRMGRNVAALAAVGVYSPTAPVTPWSALSDSVTGTDSHAAIDQSSVDDERVSRILLREANAHKPYENYNQVEDAFIGAAATLPYMAIAAVPYAGMAAVTMDQFQSVNDRVLMQGGNPHDGLAAQWAAALAYAYVEKISFDTAFGKPLTTMGRRALFLNVSKHGYAYAVRQLAGEVALGTAAETFQEMLQNGIEEGTVAAKLGKDIGREALRGFIEEADTWRTMLVISGAGAGAKAYKAKSFRADAESLIDYAKRKQSVAEIMRKKDPDYGKQQDLLNRARAEFDQARSNNAAAAALQDMGFNREQSATLIDMFSYDAVAETADNRLRAWMRGDGLDARRMIQDLMPEAQIKDLPDGSIEVTMTVKNGEQSTEKTYRVEFGESNEDITTERFAASVVEAVGGRVSMAAYLAMDLEQKKVFLADNGLFVRGKFERITGAEGETATAEGLISMTTSTADGKGASNLDLFHETFHAVISFARDAGALGEGEIKTLVEMFGAARVEGELFNEEAGAIAYSMWLAGRDKKEIGKENLEAVSGVWAKLKETAARMLRGLGLMPLDESEAEKRRNRVFESVRSGDFSGMPASAGVQVADSVEGAVAEVAEVEEGERAPDEPYGEAIPADGDAGAAVDEVVPDDAAVGEKPAADKKDTVREAQPGAAVPAPTGERVLHLVTPTGGVKFQAQWVAVELDGLQTSDKSGYDSALQPRDRGTVTSRVQIHDIAKKGVFDPSRLFDSVESDGGSPIVGGGLQVLSGNGRTLALRQLDKQGRWGEYSEAAAKKAAELGIDLTGMRRPVLVRKVTLRPAGVSLAQITELSNRSKILTRSAAEVAHADAKVILDEGLLGVFDPGTSGNLLARSNNDFMQSFARLAGAEGMLDSKGAPTEELALRVKRALLTGVLPDADLQRMLLEQSGELGVKNVNNALIKESGNVLRLGRTKPHLGIAAALGGAVSKYLRMRNEGWQSLEQYLAQGDLLEGRISDVERSLLAALEAGKVGEFLSRYVEIASKLDADGAADMFGQSTGSKDVAAKVAAELGLDPGGRYSVAARKPWAADFPEAAVHSSKVQSRFPALFNAAKAGDKAAAAELVEKCLKAERVRELAAAHPDAIVVAVHAEEASGRNAIPLAMADAFNALGGLQLDENIVQVNRVQHTGADALSRLLRAPEFTGAVESGREYIIVDDHLTSGSTVAELRHYIENNGGKVVEVSALTASKGSATIAATQKTLDKLYKRHGGYEKTKQLLQETGVASDPAALSESQARYAASLLSDTLRNRSTATRQAGGPSGAAGNQSEKVRYSVAATPELWERHEALRHEDYRLRARIRKTPGGEAVDMRSLAELPFSIKEILGISPASSSDEFAPARVIGRLANDVYQTIVNHAVLNGYKYLEFGIEDRSGAAVGVPFVSPELKSQAEADIDYLEDNVYRVTLLGRKKAGEKLRPVQIDKYLSKKPMSASQARELSLDFDSYAPALEEAAARGYEHVALGIMNGRGFWQEPPAEFSRNEFGNWNLTREYQGKSEIDSSQIEEYADAEDLPPAKGSGKYKIATVDLATGEELYVKEGLDSSNAAQTYYGSVYGDMTRLAQHWGGNKHYMHGIRDSASKQWAFFPPLIESPIRKNDAAAFPNPAHRPYAGRYSVGFGRSSPHSYVEALYTAEILAGKEISPRDVERTLKNVGLPLELAPDLIDAANRRATKAGSDFIEKAKTADRAFIEKLAGDVEKEHYINSLAGGFGAGAAAAGAGVDAGINVEKAAWQAARRDLESAAGYTAAEMQVELAVDLSRMVLEMPEIELSPEEIALRDKLRERQQELEELREADALAGVDPDQTPDEVPDNVKALVDEIMRAARVASAAARAAREVDAARRLQQIEQMESAAERAAEADGADPDAVDPDAETDEELSSARIMKLLAPVLADADHFAAFVLEWATRKIAAARGEPDRAKLYKNPAALRDLIKTSQHILGKLARDLIGTGTGRIAAEKDIARMVELKNPRAVVKELAYIYGRIHKSALRKSRIELVDGLVKQIKQIAVDGPRWQARKVNLSRKVTAAIEMYARNIISVVNMSPAEMEAAKNRLEEIISNAHHEESGVYRVEHDRKYTEAFDRLAVLAEFGGMVRWMPGPIVEASERILEDLLHKRADFEAQRIEQKAETDSVRQALTIAVRSDKPRRQLEPGRWAKAADSLMGNLELRLKHLIRFSKGEARENGLAAIEEIMFKVGRGAEKCRVFEVAGNAAFSAALKDIYGNSRKGLKHLDTKLPAEINDTITNQNIALTYGQALQLYGSIIQKDYEGNVRTHGRQLQAEALREALSPQDMALHAWLVGWYMRNRESLSEVQERITGLKVLSPDSLYIPVQMFLEQGGMRDKHQSWTPLMRTLTPRIRNQRDFDETADIVTMFAARLNDAALTVAYGETGLWLSDVVGSSAFQTEVETVHGKYFVNEMMDQFGSVLRAGKSIAPKSQLENDFNSLRAWNARFALSGNMLSALKQLTSMPVWVNVIGARDFVRYSTNIDREAVRELLQSDGYKARYRGGWSVETTTVMQQHSENAFSKLYDKGMILNSVFDGVPGLWIAQGYYRDLKAKFIDQGYSVEEATERAQTLTWNQLEQTQQSGRVENQMSWVRNNAIAGILMQFSNSPVQQFQYEIAAIREVAAGTPGARKRLVAAVVINHIIMPTLMSLTVAAWQALLGRQDEPEEQFREWIVAALLGPFARVFMAGAMAEAGIRSVVMGEKSRFGHDSTLPMASLVGITFQTGVVLRTIGKSGWDNVIHPDDFSNLTYEDIQDEIDRLAKRLNAPYRHGRQAVQNRQ